MDMVANIDEDDIEDPYISVVSAKKESSEIQCYVKKLIVKEGSLNRLKIIWSFLIEYRK